MKRSFEKNVIGKYDTYISGHEHFLSDEGVKDGTRLLISSAGGSLNYGEGGFRVIEISGQRSQYS